MSSSTAAQGSGDGGRGGSGDQRGGGTNGGGGRGGGNQGASRGRGSNRNNNNNNARKKGTTTYPHGVDGMENFQFSMGGDRTTDANNGLNTIIAYQKTYDKWLEEIRSSPLGGSDIVAIGVTDMDSSLISVEYAPMPTPNITVQGADGTDTEVANPNYIRDHAIWSAELKSTADKKTALLQTKTVHYSNTLKLCSEDLTTALKKQSNWREISDSKCPVRLLSEIKLIMYNGGGKHHVATSIVSLTSAMHRMNQKGLSNVQWYEAKMSMIKAIESLGGSVTSHPVLTQTRARALARAEGRDDPNDDDVADAKVTVEDEIMGALILEGMNSTADDYKAWLHNNHRNGNDIYPRGGPQALQGVSDHVSSFAIGRTSERKREQQRRRENGGGGPGNDDGLNFLQHYRPVYDDEEIEEDEDADEDAEDEDELHECEDESPPDVPVLSYADAVTGPQPTVPDASSALDEIIDSGSCAHCGGDHSLSTCPQVSDEDLAAFISSLQRNDEDSTVTVPFGGDHGGMLLSKKGPRSRMDGGLKKNYLYLDTCTTHNVMCSPEYLTQIRSLSEALVLHTNAGECSTDQQGYLGSVLFWLDRLGIANVISLSTLEALGPVSYDSNVRGGSFVCNAPEGTIVFHRCPDTDFPYIDLDEQDDNSAVLLVQTVRQNFEGFTSTEVEKAIAARRAQASSGHLSEQVMKREVSRTDCHSLFRDCPVSSKDITNANNIFGPSLPIIKGKQVRKKPSRVEPQYISIPAQVMELNKFVTLVADVMFVNGLPFFVTLSRNIRFATVQFVPRRTANDLSNVLNEVLMLYKRAGFICQTALMDGEFEKLKAKLSDKIVINISSKNEHVAEIERKIRDMKNTCRSITASLPFKVLPNAIIKGLVHHAVMMMNAIPAPKGVSSVFSPRELVLRWQLSFAVHCRAPFGSLCTVYDDPEITNNMAERSWEGINLGPSGNMQGSHKFYCLSTRTVYKRRQFDERPMPDSTINLINSIGAREKQEGRLRFHNRNNDPFSWTDEDENEVLIEDNAVEPPTAPFPAILAEEPGLTLQVEGQQPAMTPSPPMDVDSSLVLPHLEAIVTDALGGAPRLADAPVNPVTFNVNVVPAEDNEIEPPDDASLPQYDDQFASDSSTESSAFAPEPEEPGDHNLNEEDFVIEEDAEEDAAAEVEAIEVDVPVVINEEDANPDVRRGTRNRVPNPRYMNVMVPDNPSNEKVQVMNPRMFSNAAVHQVISTQPSVTPQSKLVSGNDLEPMDICDEDLPIMGMLFAQFSLRRGIKEFGERAEQGAIKEMKQMHDMDAFIPRHFESLTKEERMRALSTLIFLKEKSSGDIKGRTCVNGAPQREYIRKEDAASPTAATDSLFITGAIDAHERRHVACCDLPGAFLHCVTDEHVIVVLRGELAELMVQVDPSIYRQYVSTDKRGNPVLYMQLYKSVYGLMRSSLLFYRKLRGELESYGLTVNPYDPCVANMMVPKSMAVESPERHRSEGNPPPVDETANVDSDLVQLTVLWHVDDLKISCVNEFEITKLLLYLKSIYGNNISINRGKVHDYLGMTMDFSEDGVFRVTMLPFIDTIFADFPEPITRSAPSPYTDYLFKVRDEEDAQLLSPARAVSFHRSVAQLLFLCYRARKDIQPAVSFLTSRVRKPDEDDWGKLKRVLKYLKGTRSLPLRLTVDDLTMATWNIDASHAVHWDCKGQTGAGMTLGKGAITSFSRKQKINTKSSTESEIVGVDDAMPSVLWCLYFIQAQGYNMTHALVQQDNKSAILMEVNGKMSSSKRTKHIRIKYFFVTDRVAQGDIVIEHKPTGEMWIDAHTKPKQGTPFRTDRSHVMNCPINVPDETRVPICT